MPSASAKIEKVTSIEVTDPVKYFSNMLEKRIRNLEKRKIKLDNYRSDVENGKELNEDQKMAVSKYGEVLSCLEMFKELTKSVQGMAQEHARQVKKLAKKEQLERQQHEVQRLQEAFIYSHFLSCFQDEDVRSDFLNGENGAVQLTSEQLSQLDQLFKLIGPRLPTEQSDITSHYHVLAENHIFLVEGKNKEIAGTTYKNLKETLVKIKECGYFSRPTTTVEESEASSDEMPNEQTDHEFVPQENNSVESDCTIEYAVEPESNVDEQVPVEAPASAQSGPLQEVLEQQGSFNFLQESQIDLDAPHMDPAVVAVHQMAPAPSANFASSSYPSSPPVEENGKPVNNIESTDASLPQPALNAPQSVPPALDFDPSHPIPTQTFTNQSFAVMQNMIMPQAYVPVTLHHAPLPTTIAVISAPPTGVHVPVAVPVPEMADLAKSDSVQAVNGDEDLSALDIDGNINGAPDDKNKDYNYRGGYRGRGRGRGNYYRGRANYNSRGGGYQNNYYRDRNGYNDNFRRNNRGRGGGNNRGRGNYRTDAPHQQRNNYHQQKQDNRPQEQETQQ
uniref:Caprin-1 n=1 Tax=Parasteatoda tepidariorum TaxID=114398 RepID=A0A2L2XWC5_PARTP